MDPHGIDAVEGAARMGGSQDDRCDPLAAPGEITVPNGRLDATDECNMIEPGRCRHRLEVAQIGMSAT